MTQTKKELTNTKSELKKTRTALEGTTNKLHFSQAKQSRHIAKYQSLLNENLKFAE